MVSGRGFLVLDPPLAADGVLDQVAEPGSGVNGRQSSSLQSPYVSKSGNPTCAPSHCASQGGLWENGNSVPTGNHQNLRLVLDYLCTPEYV